MRTRHRALTTIAAAALLALPLASCTSSNGEEETTAASTTQDAPPTADPADATPQERIQAYLEASDAAAAEGWKDDSYNDEYLVPELSEEVKTDDQNNAESGAVITGERKLSDWAVVDESDTTATVEFCDDTTNLVATKDGDPVDFSNTPGESVAQYKLIRESGSEPWMIEQQGYYEEGTTCADHFAG